jgi:hypothetical protein
VVTLTDGSRIVARSILRHRSPPENRGRPGGGLAFGRLGRLAVGSAQTTTTPGRLASVRGCPYRGSWGPEGAGHQAFGGSTRRARLCQPSARSHSSSVWRCTSGYWRRSAPMSAEPLCVEPSEHLVKLFAQDQPHDRQGQSAKRAGLPRTRLKTPAAWRLVTSLPAISSATPRNSCGRSKTKGREPPNVLGRDGLIRLVGADRVPKRAFQNADLDLLDVSSSP